MKLLIGGVAGGASAAARSRRQSGEADIVVFELGPLSACGGQETVGQTGTGPWDAAWLSWRPRFGAATGVTCASCGLRSCRAAPSSGGSPRRITASNLPCTRFADGATCR